LACCLACFLLLPGIALSAQVLHPVPFKKLFGYTAFPAGPGEFPIYFERHWTRVLKAEFDTPCLQNNASCLPLADAPHCIFLAGKATAMDEMKLLRTVNAFFNKFPYAQDTINYGVIGYWPTLNDFFLRRAGDCKAYALSKYFALRALGLDDHRLRIVLAHLPKRRVFHAVVAVSTAKGVFILDNNTRPIDLVLPQENFTSQYVPLFMFNEKGRWTFRQNLGRLLSW
jgi:predicted transglutaminase-like cysteine proteinase